MNVESILRTKGRTVVTVPPTLAVEDLARLLTARRIGAVLVQDARQQVLGIVSERDVVVAIAQHGERALGMTAAQLMSTDITTVSLSTTSEQAMSLMTSRRVRHLPVMDKESLVGLVSIGDVVKDRITQQEHEVDSLKAYVAGGM